MTRKIDRIYEQRRAEEAAKAERSLFLRGVEEKAAASANDLREILGLGPDLRISFGAASVWDGQAMPPNEPTDEFGSRPDAANDAANPTEEEANRA